MDGTERDTNARAARRVSPGVELARVVTPDRERLEAFMLEVEPQRLDANDFRQLLMSCVMSGASDVTFQSDQQPRPEIHGILYRGMRRPLSPSELMTILEVTYGGTNGGAEIKGMKALDYSYEVTLRDGSRQRFRVNATGIYGRDGSGIEITMRALRSDTPDLSLVQVGSEPLQPIPARPRDLRRKEEGSSENSSAALEENGFKKPSEIEALTPLDGIVVIAGATGSGKSTTMAAITRYHLESPNPVKIVDIQAPIEYTFRDVMGAMSGSSSLIGQSEVGRHISSFAQGVHSALRRKPHIINVGEARDFETISASVEASLTGHLVYTTTHAGSVSDAVRRLLTAFPGNERETRAYDLMSALRFLMVQRLLPREDKVGRIPVREYLRFTDRIRDNLLDRPLNDWPALINAEVNGEVTGTGQEDMCRSFSDICAELYHQGVLSRHIAIKNGGKRIMELL